MSDAHRIALAAARGAAAAVEASRGHLNDLNVYPVPDGDTGSNLAETARELAAGLESCDRRRAARRRRGREARGADGGEREQRRDPVPDRGRLRGRRRAGARARLAHARAGAALGLRRRLPAGAAADRGHDADGDPRDGGGCRDAGGRRPGRGHRRGARRGGRERRAHPVDARGAARGGSGRRGRGRPRRVLPRCRGRRARRAHPGAARGDRPAAQPRGGAPGGVPVPVLHRVPARGRRHRPRPARDPARRHGGLPARGRRGADVPGAPAHRRPRRRPHPGRRDGQHRPRLDRQHAGADPPARGAPALGAEARGTPRGTATRVPA